MDCIEQFEVFSKIACHLSGFVAAATSICQCMMDVNNVVVETLVNAGQATLYALTRVLIQVRCALCYGVEDLNSFLTDIGAMILFLIGTLSRGLLHVFNAVNAMWLFAICCMSTVGSWIMGLISGIYMSVETVIWLIGWTGCSLWRSLTLMGRSFLFVMCSIPRGITLGANLLLNGVIFGGLTLKRAVSDAFLLAVNLASYIAQWTAATFVAIPLDAYFGLTIVCILIFGMRFASKSRRFRQSAGRILSSVKRLYRTLRSGRSSFIRAPPPDVIVLSSTDDEDEDQPNGVVREVTHVTNAPLHLELRRLGLVRIPPVGGRRVLRSSVSPPPATSRPSTPQMMREIERLKRQLSAAEDNQLCIVCQATDKCMMMVPCHHLCLCRACGVEVQKTAQCPVCRTVITQQIQIFT